MMYMQIEVICDRVKDGCANRYAMPVGHEIMAEHGYAECVRKVRGCAAAAGWNITSRKSASIGATIWTDHCPDHT